MNKDSPSSPAEQAARECARKIGLGPDSREAIEAIVSRYLKAEIDRSVAETEEKYRKLGYEMRGIAGKYGECGFVELATEISRWAHRIESLIPKQEGEK